MTIVQTNKGDGERIWEKRRKEIEYERKERVRKM
jgi:hypothetical protein